MSSQHKSISEHFIAPKGTYLLAHSVGPMCSASVKASQQYIQQWQDLGGNAWPQWLEDIDRFRNEVALLLNTKPNNICPQPTVTAGFTQWLTALRKQTKKKKMIVLMHEDAFPSLGFAVVGLQTQDIELQLVKGEVNDLSIWEDAIRSHNATAVLFTHAHSNTGILGNIRSLSKLARSYDLLVGVDIAQSAGIIPIDLKDWDVDAVFGSCVKWLSGGTGAGYLILLSDIKQLMPDHLGWFSHENPFEFDIKHFAPSNDALRFWGGTPGVQPFIVATSSINTIRTIGVETLYSHTKHLQRIFIQNTSEDIVEDIEILGGTLCVPIKPEKLEWLQDVLQNQHIHLDFRNNKIRVSFHAVHSENVPLFLANELRQALSI